MKYLLLIISISLAISLAPGTFNFQKRSDTKPAKVYITRNLQPQYVVEAFKKLDVKLDGKIALKVHSGEKDGPYFLRPHYLQKIHDYTGGTFVECNTAYNATRVNTTIHKKTIEANHWYENNRRFVLMDENEEEELEIPIPQHSKIEKNFVGKRIEEFNSSLILAHFKGHGMGGYGGALKQLSIGYASRGGKAFIHSAGKTTNYTEWRKYNTSQIDFTSSMADAASSIVAYFRNRGGIAFINVIKDVSIDCDCAGKNAKPPRINDIGILASTDPVAIDQACLDLIKNSGDEGVTEFFDRVHKLEGENTIKVAEELGVGTRNYQLIEFGNSKFIKYSMFLFGLLFLLF